MTRYYVFETLTGNQVAEFTPSKASWSLATNTPDTVDVTLDLNDPATLAQDWRNLGTPWKHSIAVEEHGRFIGGPIMPYDWDEDKADLKLTARGPKVILDRNLVLPVSAVTGSLVGADGLPNPAYDTNLSGTDYGTFGKKLVLQAMQWPGLGLPIVFHDDRPDSYVKNYTGIALKTVGAALDDLCGLDGGPDIRFQLTRNGPDGFQWVYESGTRAQPRLQGQIAHTWELNADEATGSGLSVGSDPTGMASISWATAGRSDDRVLLSRVIDTRLIDSGYPLLQVVDSSHSSISEQPSLDSVATENLRTAGRPAEFWSFKARLAASPFLNEYNTGDLITIVVQNSKYQSVGQFTRRIAAISGDEKGMWAKITCGEVYGG
ncbi:hypothetical protein ACL9RL_09290 [Plantibacter sp. Mn2098]|uniref:hypothetical protein n=1 Tax=Plantibacter sp. Mn2098 TaxID=3395266 RepID=UPI003BD4AD7D